MGMSRKKKRVPGFRPRPMEWYIEAAKRRREARAVIDMLDAAKRAAMDGCDTDTGAAKNGGCEDKGGNDAVG